MKSFHIPWDKVALTHDLEWALVNPFGPDLAWGEAVYPLQSSHFKRNHLSSWIFRLLMSFRARYLSCGMLCEKMSNDDFLLEKTLISAHMLCKTAPQAGKTSLCTVFMSIFRHRV
jgi:hypothetical protein